MPRERSDTDSQPKERLEQIDRLADQFEQEFKAGVKPRIETYLAHFPALCTYLLKELLFVEVELLRDAGQHPKVEDYRQRFPDARDIVDAAFAHPAHVGHDTDDRQNTTTHSFSPPRVDSPAVVATTREVNKASPLVIGRYEIICQIGRGSFAVVYKANDPLLNRSVALKVPHKERIDSEGELSRYLDEARHAAHLDHPGIVRVYDVLHEGDLLCVVQEYVDGCTLAKYLTSEHPSVTRTVALLMGIADAVAHAHRHRVFHRDLKPANILVDRAGHPHVADFGLAMHESSQRQRRGDRSGTPAYRSPEQVRGESHQLDGRTDIWSLGVIFYEMLTSRRPFQGETLDELDDEIKHRDPPSLREIDPTIPARLQQICLKCLEKRKTNRYASVADLADDLREWFSSASSPQRLVASENECSVEPKGPSDYFVAQQEIVEEHVRSFVGRTAVIEALDGFLAGQPFGYFLIRGEPGQGKTSLACHLVKSRAYIHHFVHPTGARSDERLIMRSLLAQLLPLAGLGTAMPDGIPEMSLLLEELFVRVAAHKGRLVIVIDALDELHTLAGRVPVFLMTDALPHQCFFVVTSRAGERLQHLSEAVSTIPHALYDLEPLERHEIRDFLRAHAPQVSDAAFEQIVSMSEGNPLYLRALSEELARNPAYPLHNLPTSVDGFFRRSTATLRDGHNDTLRDTLGLLCTARKSLSVRELSAITGIRQRQIADEGIHPIREFLIDTEGGYAFYHARFHEFVTRELIYEDERRDYHRRLVAWLQRPESRSSDYRWSSLAFHLFATGSRRELIDAIDKDFLAEKWRRCGYAVFEDIEWLSRAMVEDGNPGLVSHCVDLVESLREAAGDSVLAQARQTVQGLSTAIGPSIPHISVFPTLNSSTFDVYVGMIPKAEVGADFFQIVERNGRLIVTIGDAPGGGLKGAFIARFVVTVFRRILEESIGRNYAAVVEQLNRIVSSHEYFGVISLQCVELDPEHGVLTMVNAGHPYPVLYCARRKQCDQLPIRGEPLSFPVRVPANDVRFREQKAEMRPGDVLVLLTDGLTEGHVLGTQGYGYRFTSVIERLSEGPARAIGEAILDDWRYHPRPQQYLDDVTVVVVRDLR
jgi:serine phosphatase RsbU (regulator of sigma subunit)/tRNA A-37 threonylcarbamoyl transferase component Bud32